MKHTALALIAALCLASCEYYDFSDDTSEADSSTSAETQDVVPTSHGRGTMLSPMLPTDLLDGAVPEDLDESWVVGYAVGTTYKAMSNATFTDLTMSSTCVLLANDSLCSATDSVVAAELKTTSVRSSFALSYVPERHRQCVLLCGTYGTYFYRTGIRSVQRGQWLEGFDLSALPEVTDSL